MAPADPRALLSEALLLCGHLRPGYARGALRDVILERLAPLGGAAPVFFGRAPVALCQDCLRDEIATRLHQARRARPAPANDNARAS